MSDNLRRYRAIRDALRPWYPGQPTGTVARHLTTLAALISGIVGSKSPQLPSVATKIPDGTRPESRVKRLTRWLDNERILEEVYFLPYVDILLAQLALETLVLVMDGSGIGRGCTALMIHVVYKGRALPLAWRVRTAWSSGGMGEGETFRRDGLGACLKPGRLIELKEVHCTREAYGPIMVLCCWAKGYPEPLYLVSNMATAEEACRLYEKRFRIETFFSDQKSRGFHIHKSHLSDVQRLSRLLIAACLAYIWVVYLGSVCEKDQWRPLIHRRKRCDVSLFQLGLRLLEDFLNEELPIPVQFYVTI